MVVNTGESLTVMISELSGRNKRIRPGSLTRNKAEPLFNLYKLNEFVFIKQRSRDLKRLARWLFCNNSH